MFRWLFKKLFGPADLREKLLRVLAREPELWWGGLEMARAAEVPLGRIYPSIIRLENRGLVQSEWREREDFVTRRRLYQITPDGVLALQFGLDDWED